MKILSVAFASLVILFTSITLFVDRYSALKTRKDDAKQYKDAKLEFGFSRVKVVIDDEDGQKAADKSFNNKDDSKYSKLAEHVDQARKQIKDSKIEEQIDNLDADEITQMLVHYAGRAGPQYGIMAAQAKPLIKQCVNCARNAAKKAIGFVDKAHTRLKAVETSGSAILGMCLVGAILFAVTIALIMMKPKQRTPAKVTSGLAFLVLLVSIVVYGLVFHKNADVKNFFSEFYEDIASSFKDGGMPTRYLSNLDDMKEKAMEQLSFDMNVSAILLIVATILGLIAAALTFFLKPE